MLERLAFLPLTLMGVVFLHGEARADAGAGMLLGAGATGTSSYGFQGGWGLVGGAEFPVARNGSFLVRADYHAVPAAAGGGLRWILPLRTLGATELGDGPGGTQRAMLVSAMMGLRLHPPAGWVQTYLDALVGVGHLRDRSAAGTASSAGDARNEVRDDTNVALSFGLGLRILPTRYGRLFADAHYDFYFVEGADTPIIPVRVGLSLP